MAAWPDGFAAPRDSPAIAYSTGQVTDPVAMLNEKLRNGSAHLGYRPVTGYLHAVIDALNIPVESQIVGFSQSGFQPKLVTPANPRAVYFNDTVTVGWVRGGTELEVAAEDPRQGVIFYSLDQSPVERPQFKRSDACLSCHQSADTLGVPGVVVMSSVPATEDRNEYVNGFASDHRSPYEHRWGGWYVTGLTRGFRHLGNRGGRIQLPSIDSQFVTTGFLAPFSDIVALMVLEHQTRMVNLITRAGWEARVAGRVTPRVQEAVGDLVDYLLFADEAPLPAQVLGSSGFADRFNGMGPRDAHGRSLRQLDLERRLLRYPCSYMIYSDAFDALPPAVKDATYDRMWQILSGLDGKDKYQRLAAEDRQAVVEILRATKPDIAAAWSMKAAP